jgi:hypothetical protein
MNILLTHAEFRCAARQYTFGVSVTVDNNEHVRFTFRADYETSYLLDYRIFDVVATIEKDILFYKSPTLEEKTSAQLRDCVKEYIRTIDLSQVAGYNA